MQFYGAARTLKPLMPPDYLLLKSGRKFKDYYKAVATNFPVVNELPPEGEISFTFCDYYQLDKGKMNWEQILGFLCPSILQHKSGNGRSHGR